MPRLYVSCMNDFIRAFQKRKKTFLPDALMFVIASIVLRATNWVLPLVAVGVILIFKLAMLWIWREKLGREV